MAQRLVVVGGDAGGMSAASAARRRLGPDELEILAFEKGRYTSYAACGIPYLVGDLVPTAEHLVARAPEVFRERQQIDVRIRHEVAEIDLDRRAVRVRDLEGGTESWEGFDQLVVATGARPVRPPLPGIDGDGVFGVQTLADGIAVRRAVDEGSPRRAVVVGGGYIGLEMAEAMVRRGLDVSLVEMAPQPMLTLDPDMGSVVADAMRELGISLYLGEGVEGFELDGGRVRVVVTTNRSLPADIVVLGLGVRPNSVLAEEAGIPVGPTGGIVTDRQMRTPVEGVWSAGDCVETFHRVSRRPVAIALGTHANKQGRIAGNNLAGGYEVFPGVIGTAISKICEIEVARTGLNEREAAEAGFQFVTATVETRTRAHYYPGAEQVKVKMVAERRTGRLLGAQIVGREGAAKRIDTVATAVWNHMRVEQVAHLDLAYAPPFSPVWDPVLIAARQADDAVRAAGR